LSPLLTFDRPPKRPRTSSLANLDGSGSSSPAAKLWDPPLQQEFGEDFCKLLIATKSSWNEFLRPMIPALM
jgi:hypothetical protein